MQFVKVTVKKETCRDCKKDTYHDLGRCFWDGKNMYYLCPECYIDRWVQ